MSSTYPKIDLVIRRDKEHVIIAAVMLSESFKAGDIAAMEMFGKVVNGKIQLVINKAQYNPENKYGETFEQWDLPSLVDQEIWRGCESEDQSVIGGVIIGRDNLLFGFENQDEVSRTALVSVIKDSNHILDIDESAVFRSVKGTEYVNCFEFFVEKDESKETAKLLDSIQGNGLFAFYRTPFFSLPDGTKYRLSTLGANKGNALYTREYKDIIEFGKPTNETLNKLYDLGLTPSNGGDFFYRVVQKTYEVEPAFLEMFSRLFTEDEHRQIDNVLDAIVDDLN
ncbi:hypothetical protein [Photobacterium kishitanii]|uniref:Uncharacterized protein n=1 Tax=Photobacterium kishitanii TaxID=318456 RepID=A0A2T3KL42_9GAMM|nr:hypothetical protein [Photobacterium kishitanii]PSV00438.1 hypothetical protein C9J27_04720 [Photobacterium kishitanii]